METTRRYPSREELPASVREKLNPAQQDRYIEAYNQAWAEYAPNDGAEFNSKDIGTRAEFAHRKGIAAIETA